METQNKELYESRDALESILEQARKDFIKELEKIKMGYDVVKVVNYVINYPDNGGILLKKESLGSAAVYGTTFMQVYAEYHTICKIIGLYENEQAANNTNKEITNDIQSDNN